MSFDSVSNLEFGKTNPARVNSIIDAKNRLENLAKQSAVDPSQGRGFSESLERSLMTKKSSNEQVLQKFEAAILSTFVQAMMPKDTTSVYGEGLAGDMWKSQMAEKIADQISQRGGIGIASRLLSGLQKADGQSS